jgi:hypothetical protein
VSDGFPLGGGDNAPPQLTPDTFDRCQAAILALISNDIPEAWQQQMVETVNTWLVHATDGDLSLLTVGGAPWDELEHIRDSHKDDVGTLQGVGDTLAPQFRSGAGALAIGYIRNMQKRVGNYADVDPGDGDRTVGPYITQVSAVLKATYAVQAAYKKDLYELAKGYRNAIHALGGTGTAHAIGLIVLGLAKVGVGAATALIGASDISAAVFGDNIVTGVRDMVFGSDGLKPFEFSGTDPVGLNWNLLDGIDQVSTSYAQAADNVMYHMNTVWHSIESERETVPVLNPVPRVDTSGMTPLTVGHFFPPGQ